MIKNYLSKAIVAFTMLAGLTIVSCDKQDNALIIDGKEYYKSEVIKTDDGAIVKGNTPSEISTTLNKIRKDVADYLDAGKDYVITIETPTPIEASKGDNSISLPIPDYDTESGAKIVLNFPNGISDEAPLELKAKGVSELYYGITPKSYLEINIPSASSGVDLELYMPRTSVTLKAKGGALTIDELISTTSFCTLNIEKGVTINWLKVKSGYAVVKDGGKVLGTFAEADGSDGLDVSDKGIRLKSTYKNEVPNPWYTATEEDFYYVQKGKIIKSENGGSALISISKCEEASEEDIEITISDGAKARIQEGGSNGPVRPTVNITGEGDASITTKNYASEDGKVYYPSINLAIVNLLKNVTVDLSTSELYYSDEEAEVVSGTIYLPVNSEGCTFKAHRFNGWGYMFNEDAVLSTQKNSTFDSMENGAVFDFQFPKQTEDRTSFKYVFDSCDFNQAKFYTYFQNGDYEDYDGYMSFNNSKIGGKAITKDTELINNVSNKANTTTYYIIDGKAYIPTWDETTGKWKLVEPEAE